MACVFSIDGNMNDGTHMMAVMPFGSDGIHHLGITHTNDIITHFGTDTMTCNLLHIANLTSVSGFLWESIAQRSTDGVGGEMFYMGCEVQQVVLTVTLGMYSLYGKLSVGQGACLVEDHCTHLCEDVHVVGTFDEDTFTRGASDASEEGERHTDNQCTGTTDHEEHEGAIEPCGERTA